MGTSGKSGIGKVTIGIKQRHISSEFLIGTRDERISGAIVTTGVLEADQSMPQLLLANVFFIKISMTAE